MRRTSEALGRRLDRWRGIARLAPLAGRGVLAASLLLNLALGVLPLGFIVAMSTLLGRVPDAVAEGAGWAVLSGGLLVACGAFAAQQCLAPFQSALGEVVARRVDGICVNRLMAAALRDAPMSALDSPEVLDVLADARAALDRAMPTPGEAVAGGLALIARYTQLAGAVLLVEVVLSPVVAAVVGVTALIVRFGQRGSLGRFARMWHGLAGARRRLGYVRAFASSPAAAKEIRVLGLHDWFRDRERAEAAAYLEPLWRARRRVLERPFLWFAAVALVGGCTALVLLARAGVDGGLSLLEFAVAAQAVLIPIRFGVFFPESDVQTQYGVEGYDALLRFEETAAAHRRVTAAGAVPEVRHGICFEDVRFRYAEDAPEVLRGVDLELTAGTSTAVVGLNGAGKTTLLKLLTGVHEPTSGRITVDGHDLAGLDARGWRSRLAVIFQDYVRYELSAAANIALGAPDRDDDVDGVREAARRAGILDALERLPAGLDTVLSRRHPGGRDLSGGQWQRVALARAFFAVRHGASVLVLDEPTAMLDIRAEVEFHDRFLDLTEGLTTVIISHRFSTVRRADRIVVLEDGRVVEHGDHERLLAADGRYARLFRLQADRFGAEVTG